MFARSLLLIVALISLVWIGYSSYEMVSHENKYNPTYLFGPEDETILIVNESTNKDVLLSLFSTTEENKQLIGVLNPEIDFSVIVSSKRNQLLIETRELLTAASIKTLFSLNPSLKNISSNSFEINNFKCHYYKNHCYLSTNEFSTFDPSYAHFIFDKNSTGATIAISADNYSVTDIYVKDAGVIDYKLRTKDQVVGNKIDDSKLFSSIISSRITSYEFYEVDYLRNNDPSFLKSPINDWVKNGLVKVRLDGNEAVITDYSEGQNPLNVMYENLQKEPENYENAYFQAHPDIKLFSTTQGFYMYLMDDYVVLSADKNTCEKIVSDYKLGSTISHSPEKMADFYDLLPKKVNHRIIDGIIKQSSSIYKNTILTSTISNSESIVNIEPSVQTTRTLDVGEAISGFYLAHDNQIFVSTRSNNIQLFANGTKKWTKEIGAKIIGEPEIIDIFANDKKQLLITTEHQIHLIDVNGNEVNGFPIQIDENRVSLQACFYRWKASGYFIVPVENGKLIQFDSKGGELNVFKTKLGGIELKPVVWVSANQPFVGIYANNKFDMVNLISGKSLRMFDAPKTSHFVKLPNEIMLFGMDGNKLISYDQKGTKASVETSSDGIITQVYQQSNNSTIIVKSKNTVRLFNSKGIEWSTVRIGFNEIDDLQLFELSNGNLIISVIDGLENNVYLHNTNGQKWKQKSWEGSLKAGFVQSNSKGFSLITVVDKMVVEYKEN